MVKLLGKKSESRWRSWREYQVSNSRYFCGVFWVEKGIFGSLKLVDESLVLKGSHTFSCVPGSDFFFNFCSFILGLITASLGVGAVVKL